MTCFKDVAKLLQFNVILNLIQLCYSQDIPIFSQTQEAPRTKAQECSSWSDKEMAASMRKNRPAITKKPFNIIGYPVSVWYLPKLIKGTVKGQGSSTHYPYPYPQVPYP